MNVLQHTRNERNPCLKRNRPDRSYRDTLLNFKTLNFATKSFFRKKKTQNRAGRDHFDLTKNLFDGNQRDKESFTRCCSVRHTVL